MDCRTESFDLARPPRWHGSATERTHQEFRLLASTAGRPRVSANPSPGLQRQQSARHSLRSQERLSWIWAVATPRTPGMASTRRIVRAAHLRPQACLPGRYAPLAKGDSLFGIHQVTDHEDSLAYLESASRFVGSSDTRAKNGRLGRAIRFLSRSLLVMFPFGELSATGPRVRPNRRSRSAAMMSRASSASVTS